jgi:hypothetical protein
MPNTNGRLIDIRTASATAVVGVKYSLKISMRFRPRSDAITLRLIRLRSYSSRNVGEALGGDDGIRRRSRVDIFSFIQSRNRSPANKPPRVQRFNAKAA